MILGLKDPVKHFYPRALTIPLVLTNNAVPTFETTLACSFLPRLRDGLPTVLIQAIVMHRSLHRLSRRVDCVFREDKSVFALCIRIACITTHGVHYTAKKESWTTEAVQLLRCDNRRAQGIALTPARGHEEERHNNH